MEYLDAWINQWQINSSNLYVISQQIEANQNSNSMMIKLKESRGGH